MFYFQRPAQIFLGQMYLILCFVQIKQQSRLSIEDLNNTARTQEFYVTITLHMTKNPTRALLTLKIPFVVSTATQIYECCTWNKEIFLLLPAPRTVDPMVTDRRFEPPVSS